MHEFVGVVSSGSSGREWSGVVGSGRKWSGVVGSGREWPGVARKHSRALRRVSQRCLLVVGSGREWAISKHLWLTAKALECLRATPDHSRPLPTTPDHSRPLPTTSDHFRPRTSDPLLTTPDHEATILLRVWNAYKLQEPLPTTPKTPGHSGKVLG